MSSTSAVEETAPEAPLRTINGVAVEDHGDIIVVSVPSEKYVGVFLHLEVAEGDDGYELLRSLLEAITPGPRGPRLAELVEQAIDAA